MPLPHPFLHFDPHGVARRAARCATAVLLALGLGQPLYAQSDQVLQTVNRLRARGGACAGKAAPVAPVAALDAAAARVAGGAALDAALKSAGYRMAQAQVITVTGEAWRTQLASLLATRFCAQVGAAGLTQLGVHEAPRRLLILLAAPFAPRVDMGPEQAAARMLELVNQARAEPRRCGDKSFGEARALTWSTALEAAATAHAADMATRNYFSHTAADGSTPAQRASRAGYQWRMTGENIAAGQLSPETAMAGWLKSPGHCANLMNPGYREMGSGFSVSATSTMGAYWVQVFGTPR